MPILSSLSVLGAHFSSPPSGNWYDDSSAAHHTIINYGASQVDEGGGVKAAFFDGSTGYLTTSAFTSNIGTGDFTVEMFIKTLSTDGLTRCVLITNEWTKLAIFLRDGEIVYGNVGQDLISSVIPVNNGNWNHFAVVRDSNNTTLYINGVAVGNIGDASNYDSTAENDIGKSQWSTYFEGQLAGLRVTNTALYTSDFSIPTTLPTAVTGTQLLLNFGATAVPTV